MRGRKPKPTALKILAGDQPCRINTDEPRLPAVTEAAAPKWIGSYGAVLWRRMVPMLVNAGVLTQGDLPGLELLCSEYDGLRRDPTNAGCRDRYRRLLAEFGLTPSARSRLKSTAAPKADALQVFLSK